MRLCNYRRSHHNSLEQSLHLLKSDEGASMYKTTRNQKEKEEEEEITSPKQSSLSSHHLHSFHDDGLAVGVGEGKGAPPPTHRSSNETTILSTTRGFPFLFYLCVFFRIAIFYHVCIFIVVALSPPTFMSVSSPQTHWWSPPFSFPPSTTPSTQQQKQQFPIKALGCEDLLGLLPHVYFSNFRVFVSIVSPSTATTIAPASSSGALSSSIPAYIRRLYDIVDSETEVSSFLLWPFGGSFFVGAAAAATSASAFEPLIASDTTTTATDNETAATAGIVLLGCSKATLLSGSTMSSCLSGGGGDAPDANSCTGGLAAALALFRLQRRDIDNTSSLYASNTPSNTSSSTIKKVLLAHYVSYTDKNSAFVQMHPRRKGVNVDIMQQFGLRTFWSTASLYTSEAVEGFAVMATTATAAAGDGVGSLAPAVAAVQTNVQIPLSSGWFPPLVAREATITAGDFSGASEYNNISKTYSDGDGNQQNSSGIGSRKLIPTTITAPPLSAASTAAAVSPVVLQRRFTVGTMIITNSLHSGAVPAPSAVAASVQHLRFRQGAHVVVLVHDDETQPPTDIIHAIWSSSGTRQHQPYSINTTTTTANGDSEEEEAEGFSQLPDVVLDLSSATTATAAPNGNCTLYQRTSSSSSNNNNPTNSRSRRGVWLCPAFFSASYLNAIALHVNRTTGTLLHANVVSVPIAGTGLPPAAAKDATYYHHQAVLANHTRLAIAQDPPVGNTTVAFPIGRNSSYYPCFAGECPQGTLFARTLLAMVPTADVAFQNSGGFRGNGWAAGTIKTSHLWELLPFPSYLCTGRIQGLRLFELVHLSLTRATLTTAKTATADRLLQAAGMRVRYDPQAADPAQRLLGIEVMERTATLPAFRPLQRTRLYTFASDGFLCGAMPELSSLLQPSALDRGESVILDDVAGSGGELVQEHMARYLSARSPYDDILSHWLVADSGAVASGREAPMNWTVHSADCGTRFFWDPAIRSCVACPDGEEQDPTTGTACRVALKAANYTVLIAVVASIGGALVAALVVTVVGCEVRRRRSARNVDSAPTTGDITIVFTDIQWSTLLWATAPASMAAALDTHHKVIRECIAAFKAYEVKTAGDSFMIACDTARTAAALSVSIQERLLRQEWPAAIDALYEIGRDDFAAHEEVDDNPTHTVLLTPGQSFCGLRVRIGFSSGSIAAIFDEFSKGYDYYGPGVNLAARVEGVSQGGQILVSAATATALGVDPATFPEMQQNLLQKTQQQNNDAQEEPSRDRSYSSRHTDAGSNACRRKSTTVVVVTNNINNGSEAASIHQNASSTSSASKSCKKKADKHTPITVAPFAVVSLHGLTQPSLLFEITSDESLPLRQFDPTLCRDRAALQDQHHRANETSNGNESHLLDDQRTHDDYFGNHPNAAMDAASATGSLFLSVPKNGGDPWGYATGGGGGDTASNGAWSCRSAGAAGINGAHVAEILRTALRLVRVKDSKEILRIFFQAWRIAAPPPLGGSGSPKAIMSTQNLLLDVDEPLQQLGARIGHVVSRTLTRQRSGLLNVSHTNPRHVVWRDSRAQSRGASLSSYSPDAHTQQLSSISASPPPQYSLPLVTAHALAPASAKAPPSHAVAHGNSHPQQHQRESDGGGRYGPYSRETSSAAAHEAPPVDSTALLTVIEPREEEEADHGLIAFQRQREGSGQPHSNRDNNNNTCTNKTPCTTNTTPNRGPSRNRSIVI